MPTHPLRRTLRILSILAKGLPEQSVVVLQAVAVIFLPLYLKMLKIQPLNAEALSQQYYDRAMKLILGQKTLSMLSTAINTSAKLIWLRCQAFWGLNWFGNIIVKMQEPTKYQAFSDAAGHQVMKPGSPQMLKRYLLFRQMARICNLHAHQKPLLLYIPTKIILSAQSLLILPSTKIHTIGAGLIGAHQILTHIEILNELQHPPGNLFPFHMMPKATCAA